MKEASGELSMTAVAVVAIAAIGVLFTTLIWPSIKGSLTASAKCSSSFNCNCGSDGNAATCECSYYDDDGNVAADKITCENPNATSTQ